MLCQSIGTRVPLHRHRFTSDTSELHSLLCMGIDYALVCECFFFSLFFRSLLLAFLDFRRFKPNAFRCICGAECTSAADLGAVIVDSLHSCSEYSSSASFRASRRFRVSGSEAQRAHIPFMPPSKRGCKRGGTETRSAFERDVSLRRKFTLRNFHKK